MKLNLLNSKLVLDTMKNEWIIISSGNHFTLISFLFITKTSRKANRY